MKPPEKKPKTAEKREEHWSPLVFVFALGWLREWRRAKRSQPNINLDYFLGKIVDPNQI